MEHRPASNVHCLLDVIDRGYNRRSWHGTNLRGSIRGVTSAEACWRPAPKRHNVWEIVVHAAYWKYVLLRRLTGERRGSFAVKGSNWFERSASRDAAAWKADIALLDETHRKLRDAIGGLSDRDVHKSSPASSVTLFELIAGIAAHDVYHAGQIQLIKRLQRAR
jgi:uncharacterized damage-inducible protein DinB